MAKKSFSNTAMQFLSNETRDAKDTEGARPADPIEGIELPEGYKIVPESKTKRLHVLITPTMFKRMKAIAEDREQSVNEVFNTAVREFLERQGE